MLSCYLTRRRIGAYLDGALEPDVADATARHLAQCARCSAEANHLRRLTDLLRSVAQPADPDWTGFWPGVVRGIDAARRQPAVATRARPAWVRFRWAYGGALAAALLVSLTVWQLAPGPSSVESPVIVRSADTGQPGGSVMVYSTPEKDLTVIWVFGLPPDGAPAASAAAQ